MITYTRHNPLNAILILLAGGVAWLLWFAGYFDLSIIVTSLATLYLYKIQLDGGYRGWLSNPLRTLIPLFLAFQILGWARAIILMLGRDVLDYNAQWTGYSLDVTASACAEYLLIHLLYFFMIHLVYRSTREVPASHGVDEGRSVLLCYPVLIAALVGFLVTYSREIEFSGVVLYFTTNIMRFRSLCLMIVSRIALFGKGNSLSIRLGAWNLLVGCLILGLAITLETKMRFAVLEQVGAFGLVWLFLPRGRFKIAGAASAVLAIVAGVFLVIAINEIKVDKDVSAQVGVGSKLTALADVVMSRGASFHADAVLLEHPNLQALFHDQRTEVLKEFLGGLPMSGFITNRLTGSGQAPTLDMQFYWAFSGNSEVCSFFVSAFTTVKYAFGSIAMVLTAIGFGLLHGLVFRSAAQGKGEWNWVAVQAVTLPIGLHGIQRTDLLGVIVNIVLYVAVLRMLSGALTRQVGVVAGSKQVVAVMLLKRSPSIATR